MSEHGQCSALNPALSSIAWAVAFNTDTDKMNTKQERLLKDVENQIMQVYTMADNKVNGTVFGDGLIDADEVYLRTLIALSALRSIKDVDVGSPSR